MTIDPAQVLHDYLTGIDGSTYAIGRGMGLVLFFVGILLPIGIAIFCAITLHPTLTEWCAFLGAVAAYWTGLGAAVWTLVRGTNATEPTPSSAP